MKMRHYILSTVCYFIDLFLAVVGLPYCKGFSLAMASGETPVVGHGFLIAVASLVAENSF